MAATIDQHQRAIDAQVAQVEEIQSRFAEVRVGAGGQVPGGRAHERRRLRQEVTEVGLARLQDGLRRKRRHRVGETLGVLPDAAARDDDLFQLRLVVRRAFFRAALLGLDRGSSQQTRDADEEIPRKSLARTHGGLPAIRFPSPAASC